jgi:hypothetical protein
MQTFTRWPVAVALTGLLFASAAATAADAREDIFKAYQKMMGARFAVDMSTLSGGKTTKAHSEYETVERIHLKTDSMELIVLPEGTWMRAGGEWTQPPVDMSGMVKQFIPKSIDDLRAATKSASDDGMSTWNGQPMHAYTYAIDTTIMGIHVTSTNKIFVNAAGQIVHAESNGEAMGKQSQTTQDIRYDESIRVTAPK